MPAPSHSLPSTSVKESLPPSLMHSAISSSLGSWSEYTSTSPLAKPLVLQVIFARFHCAEPHSTSTAARAKRSIYTAAPTKAVTSTAATTIIRKIIVFFFIFFCSSLFSQITAARFYASRRLSERSGFYKKIRICGILNILFCNTSSMRC